jgi:hypothetical protein
LVSGTSAVGIRNSGDPGLEQILLELRELPCAGHCLPVHQVRDADLFIAVPTGVQVRKKFPNARSNTAPAPRVTLNRDPESFAARPKSKMFIASPVPAPPGS